jgi:hypothetical protein
VVEEVEVLTAAGAVHRASGACDVMSVMAQRCACR